MGNVFEVCINFLQTKLSHTDFGIPPNVFGILRKANVYFFSLSLSLSFFKMCASIFQSGADFFSLFFLKLICHISNCKKTTRPPQKSLIP